MSRLANKVALIDNAQRRAPEQSRVTIADVGAVAPMLESDGAGQISGDIFHIDGDPHVRT